jgi:hypothetical protein
VVFFLSLSSGLANEKTVHIASSEDARLTIIKSVPKNSQMPKSSQTKVTKKSKNFRRTAVRLGKEIGSFRPDLKVSGLF